MSLIWATRGQSWGFRFLRDGDHDDPLPAYEAAFAGAEGARVCHRSGATLAVRFPDPQGRADAAGRVIPHDFVVWPPLADDVHSVDDALAKIWPLVAGDFDAIWQESSP